jgi:hypothetical protein
MLDIAYIFIYGFINEHKRYSFPISIAPNLEAVALCNEHTSFNIALFNGKVSLIKI